ncbi:MAG: rRNA cytosine-C5-methyltransferase [Actinomycetota bacterium]|nr:rRNA cytosine-C5-methyltransferase [Actinomycetota bacterium]
MTAPPADARRVALDALVRIDTDGAYANLLLPTLLSRSGLSGRDRAFVTELVYGATRMRRACDWLVDRFVLRDVDPQVRAALRLGAYQLAYLRTPGHAAVSATVAVVPRRARGFVNAILRRVATSPVDAPDDWPSNAIRLSYPDWIVERLVADLGEPAAVGALEAMNERAQVTERPDGYVQDRASQWVADLVDAAPHERVADVCAAPGGKATALASGGAYVVAADIRPARARLVAENVTRLAADGSGRVDVVVADGRVPPLRPGSLDCVLVDAPCSGLGALRRRPDARWRVQADAVERLAELQRALVDAAVTLVRPGGRVVYSVCTLTLAESTGLDAHVGAAHPSLEPLPPPAEPWTPLGRGALLLPQAAGTDGMALFRWTKPVL